LSDGEKARLSWIQRRDAAIIGVVIGAISSLLSVFLRRRFGLSDNLGIELVLPASLAFVVGILLLPLASWSLKAFLASTEYARSHGIAAKNLRMYSFARNRE
jgi:ABC-type Fe3+-siderophore transport system permease subunit